MIDAQLLGLKRAYQALNTKKNKKERLGIIYELYHKEKRPVEVIADVLSMPVKDVIYDVLELKGEGIIPVGKKVDVKWQRFDDALEEKIKSKKEKKKGEMP